MYATNIDDEIIYKSNLPNIVTISILQTNQTKDLLPNELVINLMNILNML